jgi:hypothetical protein
MTETLLEPTLHDQSLPAPRWRWGARAAVLLPIVVAVVRALASGWFPIGDNALLAVRAYDVGTSHHPWLGSWTSASLALGVNVNNPGPLYSDLAAPFMWTVGRFAGIGPATALAVGSINAAFALGTLLVANRVGGWRAERWMLLLVAALTWAMGSELLIDIWQPHALLLAFVCLLLLTTGIAAGDLRLLPWWLGVTSLVVQTHVAYVYVAAVLSLVVLAAVLRACRRRATVDGSSLSRVVSAGARSRAAAVGAIVLAVAWLQPIVEQLFGPGEGNLQRLATNAGGGELTVGAGPAVKIVAAVTALPPWWARSGWEDSVPSTPLTQGPDGPQLVFTGLPGAAIAALSLLVLSGVLVGLVLLLRRPEQRPARMASVVSLAGLVTAVGGLTIQTVTLTGLGNHQVRWIFALSLFIHVSIGWGVAELVRAHRPTMRSLQPVLLGVVAVLVVINLPFAAHDLGPTADRSAANTLERTFDDLADFDPDGAVVYETDNVRVFEPNSAAVMMRLREVGVEFRFEGEVDIRQFGEGRRADGTEVARLRQFERADALLHRGDGCVVSLRSGVSAADEAAVDELIAGAASELTGGKVTIDITGLPADVAALVSAAVGGDADAAFRVAAQGLLPVLVDEGRIAPAPTAAIGGAALDNRRIVARVNSTLLVVATPATVC